MIIRHFALNDCRFGWSLSSSQTILLNHFVLSNLVLLIERTIFNRSNVTNEYLHELDLQNTFRH